MFELYRDATREYRWRFTASNGRVLADSGEGYKKRSACITAIERLKKLLPAAPMVELL